MPEAETRRYKVKNSQQGNTMAIRKQRRWFDFAFLLGSKCSMGTLEFDGANEFQMPEAGTWSLGTHER